MIQKKERPGAGGAESSSNVVTVTNNDITKIATCYQAEFDYSRLDADAADLFERR